MKHASVLVGQQVRRTPEDTAARQARVNRLLHDGIFLSINLETFQKLLKLGPDVHSTDPGGKTALAKALALGDDEKAQALRKAGAQR